MTHRSDPLLHDMDLPLRGVFHPLGFRLHLATNSTDVLECAAESWGMWNAEFDKDPVELSVIIEDEGELAMEPEHRSRGHLFSVVADQRNYAVMDLDRLFGYAFIARRTVADHAWFRWHFLDTMAFFLLAQRHAMAVHAACVARDGRGILLAGQSQAGKSSLAWACARNGWTYLADDSAWLVMDGDGREIHGRPYSARFREDAAELFPELAGYISRVRPNGKIGIEISTADFPQIRTASRCEAGAVVFLERTGSRPAGFERIGAAEALEELLAQLTNHREETRERYRHVARRLLAAPVYRLRYKSLEEGTALLGELHDRSRP